MQHTHISAEHKFFDLKLRELWKYRELVWLFTKRSFIVPYKQTILGPAWLFINPLLTSIVHLVLFGNIAKLSTDGIPQLLFYLSGNAIWSYFSNCVTHNANTFVSNSYLFGKVYFPRLVMPVSHVLGDILRFGIQMALVLVLLVWYLIRGLVAPHWSTLVWLPLILVQLGLLGMGCGMIISSLTTKYRDLSVLVGFGVSLWMYGSPIVYPLSAVSGPLRTLLLLNPVSAPVEYFRYALLGVGTRSAGSMLLSLGVTLLLATIGILIFNKVERTFMDTV